MPITVNGKKATLTVKGFSGVNEFDSPELLKDSELTILENAVLDQVSGVPQARFSYSSYNSNANAVASSLQDVQIGANNFLVGQFGTAFMSSASGTAAFVNRKTGLTTGKVCRVCQYSGKLYVTNGVDAPFVTDLVNAATAVGITAPVTTSVTITPSITGGSMAAGQYIYAIVYQDASGNMSPASTLLDAQINSGSAGSVVFASLPAVQPTKRIYRSMVNSDVLYYLTSIGTGTGFTDTFADTALDLSLPLQSLMTPTVAAAEIIQNDLLFYGNISGMYGTFPTMPRGYSGINSATFGTGSSSLNNSSTYKYIVTLVYADGSESVASESKTVNTPGSLGGDGTIYVELKVYVPTGFLSDPNITGIKFYRTVAGGSTYYPTEMTTGHGYLFPTTVFSAGTAAYIDDYISDATISAGTQYAGGTAVVDSSRLIWSENSKLMMFDALNFIDVEPDDGNKIVGLVDDVNGILIFKDNNIYKLYTTGDSSQWDLQRLVTGKGCSDPNTIVSTPMGVFFLYRGHIYRWVSGQAEPEDVGLKFSTSIAGVTSWMPAFFHSAYNWVVFPVIATGGNAYLFIYDTKLGTWYRFTTNIGPSPWAACARLYGSDAGKIILSLNTTLGFYDASTSTTVDAYPSSAAFSVHLRTKTFDFPSGIPLLRLRFLWVNEKILSGQSIVHTLQGPELSALQYTESGSGSVTGVKKIITDSMTGTVQPVNKLYYDMAGTYISQLMGLQIEGTLLNRGRRV